MLVGSSPTGIKMTLPPKAGYASPTHNTGRSVFERYRPGFTPDLHLKARLNAVSDSWATASAITASFDRSFFAHCAGLPA